MTTLVFAPDAVVRFRAGRIVVHNTTNPLPAFESDNPMLVGWLCQFSQPRPLASLLNSLQPADRPQVSQIVDYLRRAGVLVDAEAAPPVAVDDEAARSECNHYLRLIARSAYDLASDFRALSPKVETELRTRTGLGVKQRLLALLASIDGMRTELTQFYSEQLNKQLETLKIAAAPRNLKLHIGCGKGYLADWINIDVYPAPLALNVLRGLPLPDGSVAVIYVSHLLEHLFYPTDVGAFLAECRRVLAPDGKIRIVVPDIEKCIAAYTSNDREFYRSRRETWSWWPDDSSRLEDFLAYAGVGPDPAYLFEAHKYGYDFETLSKTLRTAGFDAIVQSKYMASAHHELRVDDVSAVAKAQYGSEYYSLFVDARAP